MSRGLGDVYKRQDLHKEVCKLLDKYDRTVLIEQYISGKDISMIYVEGLGALGPCIVNCDSEFYDYEMKSIKDDTVDIKTLDGKFNDLKDTVCKMANRLDIKGYAKLDFRLHDDKCYLIEINSQVSFHPEGEFITCAKKDGYEFNDIVTLENVIVAIQRAEMVMKIVEEIQRQIYELGDDGRLVKMQLEELIGGLEKEEELIIKDYIVPTKKKRTVEKIIESLEELSYEDLSKETVIAKLLGYGNFDNYDEVAVYTKGYRILNKIPRMPSNIVENLVDSFKSFQHILAADIESLDEVDGIGEVRARTIKQSLRRMQEQFVFDNEIL